VRRAWKPAALALALACAALAAIAVAGGGRAHASGTAASQRLNVVVIVSDDERVAGNSVMRNVQLLGKHGVTFSNYYVTTSECGPSRASILLGEYPHHTGVLANFGPHSYPAFHDTADLPVWLHSAGYRTGLVGKYLNDYTLDGHHVIPPGWDDWQAIDSVPEEKYYDYSLNENGRLVHYGSQPSDYTTTVLTQKALGFIRGAKSPFFLYFAPVAPHLPATPAPGDAGLLSHLPSLDSPALDERNISDKPWARWHSRRLDAQAVKYTEDVREHQLESLIALNRSVGEIVSTLRQRGLLDKTVILFTSDNGFLWGEHRLGGKLWPYQPSINVPLVVRTPWTEGNGTVNDAPVLNIDLASTIAGLTRVEPEVPQDGYDFEPFLRGRSEPWRKAFMVEYLGPSELNTGGPPPYIAVHTRRYLYVEYRRGWRELYDLRRDPWELRNVAADPAYAKVRSSLHVLLHRLYATPMHRGEPT
jgi:arylsulfatase A-like enzyme